MKRTFFCIAAWALVCWATTASAGESFEMVTDEDALVLSEWSPELQAATFTAKTDVPYAVETVAYSSASGNFYFWLDGFEVSSSDSTCDNGTKFGVSSNDQNDELIAQVKMAFLSGRKINVYWDSGTCVGGAPGPHYIKTYR